MGTGWPCRERWSGRTVSRTTTRTLGAPAAAGRASPTGAGPVGQRGATIAPATARITARARTDRIPRAACPRESGRAAAPESAVHRARTVKVAIEVAPTCRRRSALRAGHVTGASAIAPTSIAARAPAKRARRPRRGRDRGSSGGAPGRRGRSRGESNAPSRAPTTTYRGAGPSQERIAAGPASWPPPSQEDATRWPGDRSRGRPPRSLRRARGRRDASDVIRPPGSRRCYRRYGSR